MRGNETPCSKTAERIPTPRNEELTHYSMLQLKRISWLPADGGKIKTDIFTIQRRNLMVMNSELDGLPSPIPACPLRLRLVFPQLILIGCLRRSMFLIHAIFNKICKTAS